MSEIEKKDANSVALEQIAVSDPRIFGDDTWQPWFERLRAESPVHYCADSPFGAYWSVTTHHLIKQVDSNHGVFSSAQGMTLLDVEDSSLSEEDLAMENFITMDPPEHDVQRATVAPAVAPSN
ncbi:MAG: cytochrome P450, partial [Gammaproteobacteria bacterium]|nr:cytochrome P450 [Gammaproteobacteria bacterium]